MADFVYPPVISIVKTFWKYLDLQFTITGETNIPREGAAILAINHLSYLDFAIAGTAALPAKRLVRFMAKKEIFDHPLAGPLMRGMKHICVDRNNGGPSFVAALKSLRNGELVGIFPEATISQSFELKEMKSGVIRLAMESGAPVIPLTLWGTQRIWTKKVPRDFSRASIPITISVGTPYRCEKEISIKTHLDNLRGKMSELLSKAQSEYPDSPIGQRWAPARLGGSAPTPEMIERSKQEKKEL